MSTNGTKTLNFWPPAPALRRTEMRVSFRGVVAFHGFLQTGEDPGPKGVKSHFVF